MARDSEYKKQYCEKIESYIAKGYCRKLSLEEKVIENGLTFYLPHFGVKNPNKNGIRLVFDAAAEVQNISLNKALISGPDINNTLISILFKFRESPIAVCDVSPRAVTGIIERHYVVDYVDCFENEDEAVSVVKEVVRIHNLGGFHLRNIISNSERVATLFGNTVSGDQGGSDSIGRVLGIHWVPKSDLFCFRLVLSKVDNKILNCEKVPTKREMLSLNMSVYDPYGFLGDFIVTSNVILQIMQVWKCGVSWDEVLPENIYNQWKYWLQQLAKVKEFSVPRYYAVGFSDSNIELHVFVDASEEAMAVVAYWRVIHLL
ncbi:uncharacterized protein LOC142230149 [Haematobia irritans]|uniref:uncharacterized protein LOC142230149 n=1 Tax=Haematobia irritans TaxID=7368 RepID=UPI003F4F653D